MVTILITNQIKNLQDIQITLDKDAGALWQVINPDITTLTGDILQLETNKNLREFTDIEYNSLSQISDDFVNMNGRTLMTITSDQFKALPVEDKIKLSNSFLSLLELKNQISKYLEVSDILASSLIMGSIIYIGEDKSGSNTNSDVIEMLDFSEIQASNDIFVHLEDNEINFDLTDVQTPDYIIFEGPDNQDEHFISSNTIISEETTDIMINDFDFYFDEENGLEDGKTNFDDLLDLM